MSLKRILITTDFSKHAHFALQRAIGMAKYFQAELTCLHVINPNWLQGFKNNAVERDIIEEAELAHAKELKKIASSYPINFIILTGRTPDQINQYINDNNSELVFMGSHGTYYFNDYILGTNAESVIKHAKIPVQLIKKKPSFAYRRILVSTDFSDASKKAAEKAFQLYPDAAFQMLHVADVWYGKSSNKHSRFDEEMNQALQNKLMQFLDECDVDNHRFSIKFIGGYPANDIANYAAKWKAQLVVLGTRGHSLLHYILIGRVTDRLLRVTNTDMLVVP